MTKDDILSMAKQACQEGDSPFVSGWITMDYNEFERFAALVAEKEREACAKVAEDMNAAVLALLNVTRQPIAIAAAIRARGKSDKQD